MKKMNIIYEDKEILVVDKEAGVLTIATAKEKIKTLYHEASRYVKRQYPKNKVFIVHRLDKETSGIVILAKTEQKKKELQQNWEEAKREYFCIVEGKMPQKKETLKSYLIEDKNLFVHSTNDKRRGKLAITEYEVIKETEKYSLLKINIKTGRKNQIRVQLNDIGHPIIGDKKYKSKTNPLKRLALHAYLVECTDKKRNYHFETQCPKEFKKMFTR